MTCAVCAFADAHGWWGPDHRGTHCRGCHRSWTGKKEAHCPRCHEHFSTPNNFDAHLSVRGCAEPSEVRDKRGQVLLKRQARASGSVWVGASERPAA